MRYTLGISQTNYHEETNVFDQHRRKVQGTNKEGSANSIPQVPTGIETGNAPTVQDPPQQATGDTSDILTRENAQAIYRGILEAVRQDQGALGRGNTDNQLPAHAQDTTPEKVKAVLRYAVIYSIYL